VIQLTAFSKWKMNLAIWRVSFGILIWSSHLTFGEQESSNKGKLLHCSCDIQCAQNCTWHKTAISLTILSYMIWCPGTRFISCVHYFGHFRHLKVPLGWKPPFGYCELSLTTFCACKNHIQQPHGPSAECQKRC